MIPSSHSERDLRDDLTGVYGRSALNTRLSQEIERARQFGNPLALLLLDVDHFKSINDAFGHAHGDRVLTEFAQRLSKHIRSVDIIFRYGGDEFIALLPHADKAQAIQTAQVLLDATNQQPFLGSPPLTMTVSIGVAVYPQDGQDAETLFETADRRHYQAKRAGRARWVADDPPPQSRADLLPEEPSRLIERDGPLEALHRLLEAVGGQGRGLLAIHGPAGGGKTRFLAEIRKIARLRGFAVLSLRGDPGVKHRQYGALDVARREWEGLPAPSDEAAFTAALRQWLGRKAHTGLLATIDRLADIDRATLDYMRRLFAMPDFLPFGIAYANQSDLAASDGGIFPLPPGQPALREAVSLEPISLRGLHIWVRHSLHWEPHQDFLGWLHGETAGLPALIQQGLVFILEQGIFKPGDSGREIQPGFDVIPLGRELARRSVGPGRHIPGALVKMIGREGEILALQQLMREYPLVSITGPDGIGKTRLAIQLAAETPDPFDDGVWFVPASPTANARPQLSRRLFEVFQAHGYLQNEGEVLSELPHRKLLLVLDDIEAEAQTLKLITELLEKSPHLKILATTPEPLRLANESSFELRGLPYPQTEQATEIEQYPAVQLFLHNTRRVRHDFTLSEADRPHVSRLCRLTGGIPLALELAAAWVPTFSCQEIATRIADQVSALPETSPSGTSNHLHAVFDSFWGLLSEAEQASVTKLAEIEGAFSSEQARQSAGVSPFFLEALTARSFLGRASEGQYDMHIFLRGYLRGKTPD